MESWWRAEAGRVSRKALQRECHSPLRKMRALSPNSARICADSLAMRARSSAAVLQLRTACANVNGRELVAKRVVEDFGPCERYEIYVSKDELCTHPDEVAETHRLRHCDD